ncbi:hypothetical protein ACFX13_021393 [Malus domestica]|uniref:uncharacterized protein n=1 Tax=Malus domestica TaxID=3750 RepID=UPI0004991966|nr:uncharacterized protein LOC103403292 [Malus domestica]
MPSSTDGIPPSKEGRQMSMFQPNSFTVDDIDTSKNRDIFPRQQQQPSMPVSPFTMSSPSPTPLGLILQSSVFKELVENNLNGDNEESEKNDLNLLPEQNNSDTIKRILYEGMRNNPCTCSSNSGVLPALESQEESLLPLSNSRDQPL